MKYQFIIDEIEKYTANNKIKKLCPINENTLSEYVTNENINYEKLEKQDFLTYNNYIYNEAMFIIKKCQIDDFMKDINQNKYHNYKLKSHANGSYGSVHILEKNGKNMFIVKIYYSNESYVEMYHESMVGMELYNKAKRFLPNYPYYFTTSNCEDAHFINSSEYNECKNKNNKISIIEYVNDSIQLYDYIMYLFKTINYTRILTSYYEISLQLYNALNLLNIMNVSYVHRDLHGGNILVKKLDKEYFVPIYNFILSDDKKNIVDVNIKYLKTTILVYVIDFGYNQYLSYDALKFYKKECEKTNIYPIKYCEKEFKLVNFNTIARNDAKYIFSGVNTEEIMNTNSRNNNSFDIFYYQFDWINNIINNYSKDIIFDNEYDIITNEKYKKCENNIEKIIDNIYSSKTEKNKVYETMILDFLNIKTNVLKNTDSLTTREFSKNDILENLIEVMTIQRNYLFSPACMGYDSMVRFYENKIENIKNVISDDLIDPIKETMKRKIGNTKLYTEDEILSKITLKYTQNIVNLKKKATFHDNLYPKNSIFFEPIDGTVLIKKLNKKRNKIFDIILECNNNYNDYLNFENIEDIKNYLYNWLSNDSLNFDIAFNKNFYNNLKFSTYTYTFDSKLILEDDYNFFGQNVFTRIPYMLRSYYLKKINFKHDSIFFKKSKDIRNNYLISYEVFNLAKQLLPNFLYTYGCDKNKIYTEKISSITLEKFIINNIKKLTSKNLKYFFDDINNILLQISNAMSILNLTSTHFIHNELNVDNIRIRILDEYVYIPIYDYILKKSHIIKYIDLSYIKTKYIVYILNSSKNEYYSTESLFFYYQNYKMTGNNFISDINTDFIYNPSDSRKEDDFYNLIFSMINVVKNNSTIEINDLYNNKVIYRLVNYLYNLNNSINISKYTIIDETFLTNVFFENYIEYNNIEYDWNTITSQLSEKIKLYTNKMIKLDDELKKYENTVRYTFYDDNYTRFVNHKKGFYSVKLTVLSKNVNYRLRKIKFIKKFFEKRG